MDINPIETYYNGYRFRSRLEARWAVFFDALEIEYEYEPEGYEMSDGTKYLPDFYLPTMKYYVEVKGKNDHLVADLRKVEQFVLEAKAAIIVLSGIPYDPGALGLYWFPIMYYMAKSSGCVDKCYAFFQEWSDGVGIQDDYTIGCRQPFNYKPYAKDGSDRANDWAYSKMQAISGNTLNDNESPIVFEGYEYTRIENALIKARQARFEHGEMPIFT